jgi:hypothetical protein
MEIRLVKKMFEKMMLVGELPHTIIEMEDEDIDLEDLDQAYEEDLDKEAEQATQTEQPNDQQPAII